MSMNQQLTVPAEAEMREALARRDPLYDGVFYYGVITTGVFCAPSCAARPARPENIRFFLDAADAERAGFRPCLRCRPLDVAAELRQLTDLARYIERHADEKLTLNVLAERTAMPPSRLRKRFKACLGVSPAEFQDQIRLNGFKQGLQAGANVSDAIFDAGYGSTSRVYGMAARSIGMTPKAYRAGGAGETLYHATRETALGELMLAATTRGVCFAQFGESEQSLLQDLAAEFPRAALVPSAASHSPELDSWLIALDAHLSANAPRPDLPLDLRGTAFQIRVWRYLLSVPEGAVISYGELAAGIGSPTAVRAAASACGANRIATLVPCHRVLRGDGSLGGYRWGTARKRTLLANESKRATIRDGS